MEYNYEFYVEVEPEPYVVEYEVDVEYDQPNFEWQYEEGYEVNNYENDDFEYQTDENVNWDDYQNWGARNNDYEVEWKGWFKQDGDRYDMYLQNFQYNNEGEIWGHGNDDVGTFNISGRLNWDHNGFEFHKSYVGAHTVIYRGKRTQRAFTGRWEIPGNCDGVFTIYPSFRRWTGHFWQDGERNEMQLDMRVSEFGVFGTGSDDVGDFNIRGDVQDNYVSFAKTYIGAHTVLYHGYMENMNEIKGEWKIPGNCEGRFYLCLA